MPVAVLVEMRETPHTEMHAETHVETHSEEPPEALPRAVAHTDSAKHKHEDATASSASGAAAPCVEVRPQEAGTET